MTNVEARTIAERLGLPEEIVRALQRKGFLLRLDLDDDEIRERLWQAHCASTAASGASLPPQQPALGLRAAHRPAEPTGHTPST